MDLRLLPYNPDRDVYRLLRSTPEPGPMRSSPPAGGWPARSTPIATRSRRATEEMQVVNAVRGLLTDPAARAEYDMRAGASGHARSRRRRRPG